VAELQLLPWIAGAFGLLIGSFLNVCISRLPNDESVVTPRSHCPRCGAWIAWYDNIPVLSFLFLRARCRECHFPISSRYPIVELLTGGSFFWVVAIHGWSWNSIKWCLFAALLIELGFSDWETRILPDEFTKIGTLTGLLLAAVVPLPPGIASLLLPATDPRLASFLAACAGAGVLSGMMWLIGAAYRRVRGREGLGFGDVKLLAMIGAFLGMEGGLLALMIGSVIGAVLGMFWIYRAKADAATFELPFGSFLAFAAAIVGVWEITGGQ
jgi:leader peptidase (prepilin peptidase) / N-methyltransferase